MVQTGLEVFLKTSHQDVMGKKIGLLSNQASTDRDFVHSRIRLQEVFGKSLTCLFSPQHGFYSEKQDNMIESDHRRDLATGLPLYSLYGTGRKPEKKMFDDLDILIIDLVDVGTRVYTFLYTMAYCLEAAAIYGKKVIVLDRPNPLGGVTVEGNILEDKYTSFVGLYPLPMRHGLSFGELANYINTEFSLGADLEIVGMHGWKRNMYYEDTGLPWVFPSPNMPTPLTAMVYPGQVIWEGTNISEGRGTTLPFELVGAPFLDCNAILGELSKTSLPGCTLRPLMFEPTFGKWAGEACHGFHIHVLDRNTFLPYRTSLALLQAVMMLYPNKFLYKEPPYEYEYERLPMDLILGSQKVRMGLEKGIAVSDLEEQWHRELDVFNTKRENYFLY